MMIGTVSEEIHQLVVFPFALFFLKGHIHPAPDQLLEDDHTGQFLPFYQKHLQKRQVRAAPECLAEDSSGGYLLVGKSGL